MDVSLVSRVIGLGRFFLVGCQSFLWRSRFPVGPCVAYFNLPTWGGVGFIPSLSEGGEAPEAIYLALVEKV
jgi:hypothetical protein